MIINGDSENTESILLLYFYDGQTMCHIYKFQTISESFFENLPLSQCVPLSAPALHGQALRNVGGQLARQTYLRANKDLLLPYCTHWGDRKIKDPADKVAVSEIHKMYTIIVLKWMYWLQSMYTAKWMTLDGWTDRWMDKDRQTDRQIDTSLDRK